MSIISTEWHVPQTKRQAPREGAGISRSGAAILRDLEAIILLTGSIRTNGFLSAVARSILDLPVTDHMTLLDRWIQEASALAEFAGRMRLPLRLVINGVAPKPRADLLAANIAFQVERDPAELRGTGGILRDVCGGYRDDAWVLVATGARLISGSLPAIAASLAAAEADAAVAAQPDGTPSGVMLIRCALLREIAKVGFVDMQEQGLPAIARRHRIQVVRRSAIVGASIRKCSDYISAVRAFHRDHRDSSAGNAFTEECFSSFALRELGSDVASDATLHDSVVLRGGRVESGAVVVRSVVCPGAMVGRHQTVIDQAVSPARNRRVFA